MSQEAQTEDLYQPRGVGGKEGWEVGRRGGIYVYHADSCWGFDRAYSGK